MQIIQYWALHCFEQSGYLLRFNVGWTSCSWWSSLCSKCKWEVQTGREVSAADEGGSERVRVPIMQVLLLPSGHRWPFDPGHGLNVKGHQPGSVQTLVRDASPWQHSAHYKRRPWGGCFAFCMLKSCTGKHKHTRLSSASVRVKVPPTGFQWTNNTSGQNSKKPDVVCHIRINYSACYL